MENKLISKKLVVTYIILTLILLVGCSEKKLEFTRFQESYFDICEGLENKKSFSQDELENIIGDKVLDINVADDKNSDLNCYTFKADDEEIKILINPKTNNIDFIKYEKIGEIKLVNSLKENTDIGGYKYGFTSEYKLKDINSQKKQFNNK